MVVHDKHGWIVFWNVHMLDKVFDHFKEKITGHPSRWSNQNQTAIKCTFHHVMSTIHYGEHKWGIP